MPTHGHYSKHANYQWWSFQSYSVWQVTPVLKDLSVWSLHLLPTMSVLSEKMVPLVMKIAFVHCVYTHFKFNLLLKSCEHGHTYMDVCIQLIQAKNGKNIVVLSWFKLTLCFTLFNMLGLHRQIFANPYNNIQRSGVLLHSNCRIYLNLSLEISAHL